MNPSLNVCTKLTIASSSAAERPSRPTQSEDLSVASPEIGVPALKIVAEAQAAELSRPLNKSSKRHHAMGQFKEDLGQELAEHRTGVAAYNILNPRRGIMMRIMQSFHIGARRRRNARVPVDIWRKPSGPTAPRSGNMSFSHCSAHHPGRRLKCNSGRSQFLPLQSSNVYVHKLSQTGCRFISKSFGKK